MTSIYHNPRCSKSRATLALLNDNGVEPEIIEYLKVPLDKENLSKIIQALDCSAREIMRTGESIYKDLDLKNKDLDNDALLQIIVENPILLERPIVVSNNRAAIGRPPESVLDIL